MLVRNIEGIFFAIIFTDHNHYNYCLNRSGDEPEPIDLTHLNVEASMMSLASKIRVLCGKANSPTLSNRTFR